MAIFVQTAALSGKVFHLMRNFSRFWHQTARNESIQTWDLQVFALHSINGEVKLTLAQWTSLRSPPWHTATHRSQWKSALTGGALPRDSTADKGEDVHETDGGETKISVGSFKVNIGKIISFIHFSWNEVSHQSVFLKSVLLTPHLHYTMHLHRVLSFKDQQGSVGILYLGLQVAHQHSKVGGVVTQAGSHAWTDRRHPASIAWPFIGMVMSTEK